MPLALCVLGDARVCLGQAGHAAQLPTPNAPHNEPAPYMVLTTARAQAPSPASAHGSGHHSTDRETTALSSATGPWHNLVTSPRFSGRGGVNLTSPKRAPLWSLLVSCHQQALLGHTNPCLHHPAHCRPAHTTHGTVRQTQMYKELPKQPRGCPCLGTYGCCRRARAQRPVHSS